MKRLQQWFDLIAGISHDEQARLERARAIFCTSSTDVEAAPKSTLPPLVHKRACGIIQSSARAASSRQPSDLRRTAHEAY